ncbi:MAG: DUF4330 domain-containing protein [Candidatus Omnitrophica bacterium]|nr:DUF4330 domain-containing protein [Candidatus Omnitrophota bacterium]
MKIIDEQGKLFGKINVIDFLVIIFLIFLARIFYYGYKLYIAEKATQKQLAIDLQIKKEREATERRVIKGDEKRKSNLAWIDQDRIAKLEESIGKIETKLNMLLVDESGIIARINALEKDVRFILSSPKIKKPNKR